MIIDTKTNEEIEDLSYFAKDSSILGKIALVNNSKLLITLTFNTDKSISYLNSFDVDSEKIITTEEFHKIIGKFSYLLSLKFKM